MAIINETSKTRFTGDAVTVDFDFNFKIFAVTDLDIFLIDTSVTPNVSVLQTLTTDYSVAFNPTGEGGTVTMVVAPIATDDLLIARVLDFTQPTEIPTESNIPEKSLENAYDKGVMLAQQNKEELTRTAKLPITTTTTDIIIPEPDDGKALIWDGVDGQMENSVDKIDDIVTDATAAQTAAENAQAAAETAQTNAETAETNAETAETNAETAETNAAASAASAASQLTSALYRDIVFLTSGDSPRTILSNENGKMFSIDTSGGAVIINIPEISSITTPFNLTFKLAAGVNPVTINRGGAVDLIDGVVSKSLTLIGTGLQIIADTDPDPNEWTSLDFGAAGGILSITTKIENYSILSGDGLILADAISGSITLALPTAVGIGGKVYQIKRIDNSFIIKDDDFVDGDVTVATDNINIASHPFVDLQKIQLTTSGTLPAGLALATDYYIIFIDSDNIKLASSRANAVSDTAVDITAAAGGGTHTVTTVQNSVIVDGDASETIDSEATREIFFQENYVKIVSDNLNWVILDKSRYVEHAHFNIFAGYGNPDNKIPFFTTVLNDTSNKLATIVNNSTNGLRVTALRRIRVTMNFIASGVNVDSGISLYSTQLTTIITSINNADRLAYSFSPGGNDHRSHTAPIIMEKGDVLRPHTDGVTLNEASKPRVLILLEEI